MQYIITDTETVGLNVPKTGSGVVQVAWQEFDPVTLEMQETISRLVNPEAPIDPGAEKIHGKSYDMVKDQPTLGEIYKFDKPLIVVGHNIPFDLKFLGGYIDNLAGSFCTLAASRHLFPKAPNHKLTTMVKYLGLKQEDAHDAGGDVKMTGYLLQRIVMECTPRTFRDLLKSGEKPKMLNTVPFGAHKGKTFMDMPNSYIKWILDTADMHQDMHYTAQRIATIRGI